MICLRCIYMFMFNLSFADVSTDGGNPVCLFTKAQTER